MNAAKRYTRGKMTFRTAAAMGSVALVLACGAVRGADWPAFMGPNGDGTVKDAKVARTWPGDGPPVLWTVDIGPGFGGPAIANGKVYLLDRVSGRSDVLRVFDLKTGKELWASSYRAPGRVSHPGSRSTPFVDGQYVYTVGTFGHLHCFDMKALKVLWSTDISQTLGAKRGGWGSAQSPLVMGDLVIVSVQGREHGLAALNKLTGKVVWQSGPIGGSDCYSSPMSATIGGVKQIVMFQNGVVAGLAPADGKMLWKYTGYSNRRPIPNPVVMPDGRIFITGGYGGGCAMIRVTKSGDTFTVTELFRDKRSGSKVPPAVYHDGHIYSNTEIGDGLQCISADGQVKWKTGRKLSLSLGSLLIADDLIFVLGGSSGVLHLVEASPKGFKELAQAKLLGGKEIWAPMALSNGLLVIRDQKQMKCLNVAAK